MIEIEIDIDRSDRYVYRIHIEPYTRIHHLCLVILHYIIVFESFFCYAKSLSLFPTTAFQFFSSTDSLIIVAIFISVKSTMCSWLFIISIIHLPFSYSFACPLAFLKYLFASFFAPLLSPSLFHSALIIMITAIFLCRPNTARNALKPFLQMYLFTYALTR